MNRYDIALGKKPVIEDVPSVPSHQQLVNMLSRYDQKDFPYLRRKLAHALWPKIAKQIISVQPMSGPLPGISGPHTFSIESTPNTDMDIYRAFQDWVNRANPHPGIVTDLRLPESPVS
jgi:hypothetical protein